MKRQASLFFVLVTGFSSPAWALILKHMELEDLAVEAHCVVFGTVVKMESRFDPHTNNKRIVTDVSIEVQRVIAGDAEKIVVVTVPGGEVDGKGQLVPGAPRFMVGEEVLLFLSRRPDSIERYSLVGFTQGVFKVVRDRTRVKLRQSLGSVVFQNGTLGEALEMEFFLEELEEKVRKVRAEVLKR